jgi:parallel beta-helix repeat protein
MIRKWLSVGFILLFVGIAVAPAVAQNTQKSQSTSRGTWLYVGGGGPGNYTRIQDAINDTQEGDTVYVFDESSPYTESLRINKSIQLIGENTTTTILNATSQKNIRVLAPKVFIGGFTLLNYYENYDSYGVDAFDSEYLTFKNNIVIGCDYGLQLSYFSNCTIENNEIRDGTVGIDVYKIFTSTFANNSFIDNKCGIELNCAQNNILSNNTFMNNGVSLVDSSYPNTFIENTVNGKALLYFENESDMVIDNESIGQLFLIGCKNITIQNIEVTNATLGIEIIHSDNCLVTNTKLYSNYDAGIALLEQCQNNTISFNDISYNHYGILCESYYFPFKYNTISGNTIRFNKNGISLDGSKNTIRDNIIKNNNEGIEVWPGFRNRITNNIIANSMTLGLYLYDNSWCLIKSNNFINNQKHTDFEKFSILRNLFQNNYWSDSTGFGPKLIWGLQNIKIGYNSRLGIPIYLTIPWVQFDWFPAKEPYDIP